MPKLRILFFLNSTVRAGVEEVVLSLVRWLDRRKFEVHLAAPEPLLRSFAPELAGVPLRMFPIQLWSWKQARQMTAFVRYLRRERIQVVNSHLFISTVFAAPLARLAGVPAVIETTHGPEAWRRAWWKRTCWVDRFVERFVTANIAVSQANREYLVRGKRYPGHKVRVVPNGRDLCEYRGVPDATVSQLRSGLGLGPQDRIIGVIGRLEEQKGHRYLLSALPEIVRRFPTAKTVLVGDGTQRADLEKLARTLGVEQNVLFAGFAAPVAPFYALSELVVLPSLYEGMPLVAIEAGAAGRPIVATAAGGTSEVVENGVTGLLVPPRSPEALARAIRDLLADPPMASRLGLAAQRRTERLFSIERQIDETSRIYRDCCAEVA